MASPPDTLRIELAYARPERQWLLALEVQAGTTARQAVLGSGLNRECPELDLAACPLGIFGQVVEDERPVRAGDRVEIYRPLQRDPREVRRELAARGLTMGPAGRGG
jgi:putative ubiquitin-RnfH superfamily antitoxin RatB of RatAB toxin-antitoxin module